MFIIQELETKKELAEYYECMQTTEKRLKKVFAGEIAAAVGLKETITSDTLCDEDHPVELYRIEFPEPVIQLRVEPKTKS